ncbi:MAG: hypothetical protein KC425_15030 [Anaerolineales bacterium]|nr:hypothetical protein [Anaerolineales bacterium]
MKKSLTLIILLLFMLAACTTPTAEQVTELLPGSEAAAEDPTAEPAAAASADVNPCATAEIPSPSEGLVMVHFINMSGGEMNLLWHDTEQTPAQLVEYTQVAHGESYDQQTYTSHEWLMQDEHGHMLGNYVAKGDATQCVVV